MNRSEFRAVHAAAGAVALLCIGVFLASTLWVELTGGPERIAAVKRGIVYGLALLVPAMVVVGMSGARLGGRSQGASVVTKQRRMRVIAMNGLLVLVPAALILDRLASAGAFGTLFYTVQAAELVAGPVNFVLLSLNFRDGLRMSRRIGRPERAAHPVTNRAGANRERQAAPAAAREA